jgi:hypothetical protein
MVSLRHGDFGMKRLVALYKSFPKFVCFNCRGRDVCLSYLHVTQSGRVGVENYYDQEQGSLRR